jgi:Cyclin.
MLAAKFFDDHYYNNEYYAKVGGISNKEINILEVEFLNYINFNLYVDPILFLRYRQRLLSQIKSG